MKYIFPFLFLLVSCSKEDIPIPIKPEVVVQTKVVEPPYSPIQFENVDEFLSISE
jgi:hypothetical protein